MLRRITRLVTAESSMIRLVKIQAALTLKQSDKNIAKSQSQIQV